MKNFILVLFITMITQLFASYDLKSNTISTDKYLMTGITEYQNKNFDKALDNFLLAKNSGAKNPDVYYNIGNTYFRLNNISKAIVYYKRALLLDSSYKPAINNLEFTLSMTKDKQIETEDNFISRLIIRTLYFFPINKLLIIILLLVSVIVSIIHVEWKFTNIDRTIIRFINFILLFFLIIISGLTTSRIYLLQNNNEAVITNNTIYVFSGPSESFTRLFTLHEGTVLKVHKEEADWSQITTLNGFSGWINSNSYIKISE